MAEIVEHVLEIVEAPVLERRCVAELIHERAGIARARKPTGVTGAPRQRLRCKKMVTLFTCTK